jgi:hypothetical protein
VAVVAGVATAAGASPGTDAAEASSTTHSAAGGSAGFFEITESGTSSSESESAMLLGDGNCG